MKGFETGIVLRSSDKPSDEFGCTMPQEQMGMTTIIQLLTQAMEYIKPFLPSEDNDITNGFDLVMEYVAGFTVLVSILDRDASYGMDMYCRGLLFG